MKVAVVCYYWPPAGGPGVQRWFEFVRRLPSYGIDPVVIVPKNPHYPITDSRLGKSLPEGVRIVYRPIWEPYGWASLLGKKKTTEISRGIVPSRSVSLIQKILLWIRGNLFIPDARIAWVKPTSKWLEAFLKKENIETLITTGPPHSLHLIGIHLKAKTGIRWIADFRDPWTNIGYHHKLRLSKYARNKHIRLEKSVLMEADEVIVTSFTTGKEFKNLTSKPVHVLTNGYGDAPDHKVTLDKEFSLSHIGTLLTDRNPEILWKVLGSMCREVQGFKEALKIKLAGTCSSEVLRSIASYGLTPQLMILGYVSHDQARELQSSSRLLLLLEINASYTRGIIPGKLFEYLQSRRPILAIGPDNWDAGKIIAETHAGHCLEYGNEQNLRRIIQDYYDAWKRNEDVYTDGDISAYSREEITRQLAGVIKRS